MIQLIRKKKQSNYTLSTLKVKDLQIDVIEPPVVSNKEGEEPTLAPGQYKLFVKPNEGGMPVLCFQKHKRNHRFGFAPIDEVAYPSTTTFESSTDVFNHALWCGNYNEEKRRLEKDHCTYSRILLYLITKKAFHEAMIIKIKDVEPQKSPLL